MIKAVKPNQMAPVTTAAPLLISLSESSKAMINLKYYLDKEFRKEAVIWWRSLSINQQKAYAKALPSISNQARDSEIAEIYDNEIIKKKAK